MATPAEEVDKWFEVRQSYYNQLEAQLTNLARVFSIIARKHRGTALLWSLLFLLEILP